MEFMQKQVFEPKERQKVSNTLPSFPISKSCSQSQANLSWKKDTLVTTKLTFHTSLESHLNQSKVVGISYIKEERDFKVVGQQISSRSIFIGETKSNTEPNIFYEE